MDGYEKAEAVAQVAAAAEVVEVKCEPEAPNAVRPLARRIASARAEAYKQKVHRSVVQNIGYYTTYITQETERLKGLAEESEKNEAEYALAWSLVMDAGFKPHEASWPDWTIDVLVKESQLARLAKAIGRLDMDNAEKSIENKEKNTIRITARSVEHKMIRVSWVHVLTEADPCKIEKVVREELVCGVNK